MSTGPPLFVSLSNAEVEPPGSLRAGNVTIRWEAALVTLRMAHWLELRLQGGGSDCIVQLSRAVRRRDAGWFDRLLGDDDAEHWLNVSLRQPDASVVLRLSAPCTDEALLEGLPELETEGYPVDHEGLVRLLRALVAAGGRLAGASRPAPQRWLVTSGQGGAPDEATSTPVEQHAAAGLREALAAAGPGDVVELGAGQWSLDDGALRVDRAVRLVGAGRNATVLFAERGERVLHVTAGDVEVRGIGFRHGGRSCQELVLVEGEGAVRLVDCDLSDGRGSGLRATKGSVTLERCRLDNNRVDGLLAAGTARVEISESQVLDNGHAGINLTSGEGHVARSNRCEFSGHAGINAVYCGSVEITDNDCNGSAYGIWVQAARAHVVGNRCGDCSNTGLIASSEVKGQFEGNVCRACGTGIGVLGEGADVQLVGNLCEDNALRGMVVRGSARAAVTRNRLLGSGAGLEVSEQANVDAFENRFERCEIGITVEDDAKVRSRRNAFESIGDRELQTRDRGAVS